MELKAINIKQKDYNGEDDFFLSCEVFIGSEKNSYVYEVYDFNVISIKRLYKDFKDDGIMLNRGWMIAKHYDEDIVKEKISSIIKKCDSGNDEETYLKLDFYFRRQES